MHPDLLDAEAMARQLRQLPSEAPPPMGWDEFQQRAAEARRPRAATFTWRSAAMAAGLAGLMFAVIIWSRIDQRDGGAQVTASRPELPMLALPNPHVVEQAKASERWLARLPAEPVVIRVSTRSAVADLEDRIAWMDDVLSAERPDAVDPHHIIALQHERARLVNSLAQVRYAESLMDAAQ